MTSESMVEKEAGALCVSQCLGDPGEHYVAANWPRHADAARAAIAAMREPTEEMIAAAGVAGAAGGDIYGNVGGDVGANIHRAMIDSALSHPMTSRDGERR